jgi:hypothetical protein
MSVYVETAGGLTVRRDGQAGWTVSHAESGLYAVSGLRQRRFAEQARDDFLASGVDFTRDKRAVFADRDRWREPYQLWYQRARLAENHPETGEYYSTTVHYGSVPNSAQAAAEYRAKRAAEAEAASQVA